MLQNGYRAEEQLPSALTHLASAKVETAIWVDGLLRSKLVLLPHTLLGSCLHLPVLCLEVAVQDLHRAVVDALLLVRLQLLNLVQPAAVLHNGAEGVDLVGVANRLRLPDLEDVLQALKSHGDYARVEGGEQVAQRRDAAGVHKKLDLLGSASGCGVADSPRRFLLDVKFRVLQQLYQRRDDAGVHHRTDLVLSACGDVGYSPARFLLYGLLLRGGEQAQEADESSHIDHDLRLLVVARHNIAHRPQRRHQHRSLVMRQQLHQATADSGIDDVLDAVVGPIRQVRQCPACVRQHLVVLHLNQPCQRGERLLHHCKIGLRLAPTEVGEGPRGVAHHADLDLLLQLLQQRLQRAGVEHHVAALGRVPCNVAQRPHSLLSNVVMRRPQQVHEYGHGSMVHHHTGMLAGARGYVGQRPGCFKLQLPIVLLLEKLHKAGDDPMPDDLLDWRVLLNREYLPKLGDCLQVKLRIRGVNSRDHCVHILLRNAGTILKRLNLGRVKAFIHRDISLPFAQSSISTLLHSCLLRNLALLNYVVFALAPSLILVDPFLKLPSSISALLVLHIC